MIDTALQTFGPSIVARRFVLTFADLTAAATTQTIALLAVPKATLVLFVRIKHQVAFSGGGLTTMTVSVGSTAGSATTFKAAFDVFQAVADTTFAAAAATALCATYAADTINAYFTGSGNVNLATAGQVTIDLFMWQEPDLTATAPVGVGGTAGAPSIGGQI